MSSPVNWNEFWALTGETLELAAFITIQLSMVVFLLRKGRQDRMFREAFYVFFVTVTIVDCAAVVVGRLHQYNYRIFLIGELLNPANMFATVAAHFQSYIHTAIAVNRFTALCLPLRHSRIWRARTVFALIVVFTLAALLLGAGISEYFIVTKPTESALGYFAWSASTCLVYLLCCSVSFVLSMCTVLRMAVMRNKMAGPEVRLFVHSLFMLLLQTWLAFISFVNATDEFVNVALELKIKSFKWLQLSRDDVFKRGLGDFLYNLLADYPSRELASRIFALSGSILLLLVSARIREEYFRFYFTTSDKSSTMNVSTTQETLSSRRRSTLRHLSQNFVRD